MLPVLRRTVPVRRVRDLRQHRPELQPEQGGDHLLPVVAPEARVLHLKVHRGVPRDRGQPAALERHVTVLFEQPSHTLCAPQLAGRQRLDLVQLRVHLLEPIAALQHGERGLLADSGDARDVVRRVALEPLHVRERLRHQPGEALPERLDAVHLCIAEPGVHQDVHGVRHELQLVPVARHHQRIYALLGGDAAHGADQVVGLPSVLFEVRDLERVQDVLDERELLAQLVRGRWTARLVLRVSFIPEGRRAGVERHRSVCRLVVSHHLQESCQETVCAPRILSGRCSEPFRNREERPVHHGVPVNKQKQGALVVRKIGLSHGAVLASEGALAVGGTCGEEGVGRARIIAVRARRPRSTVNRAPRPGPTPETIS